MICFICNNTFSNFYKKHIYKCASEHNINISQQDIKFKQLLFELNIDIDYSFMYNNYVVNKMSLPDFLKIYGIKYQHTLFLLKYYHIPTRSISESANLITKHKYKKTVLNKYGVDNISQLQETKDKKKNTFLKNYGVDNIFKSEQFKAWLPGQMKLLYGKGSLPNKYGNMQKYWDNKTDEEKRKHMKPAHIGYSKFWNSLSDEQKNRIIQSKCTTFVHHFQSSLETRIQNILTNVGISFTSQYWLENKSYDIKLSDARIILEIQGDYWHANPLFYKSDDLLQINGKDTILAKDIWERDYNKKLIAEKYNNKVVYIWETDINNLPNDDDLLLFILNEVLRITTV